VAPYRVTVSPGAERDPMVAGIERFDANDEQYISVFTADVVALLETRWAGTTQGFAEAEWPVDEPRLVLYRRPLGAGEVLYLTLGHCRSTWDMAAPPFNGMRWPRIERGSWELDELHVLLHRGIEWAKAAIPPSDRPVPDGAS
jgi:type 1 glutamine amidotransferase